MVKEEGVSFASEDSDNGSTGGTLFVTVGCAILHGNWVVMEKADGATK